MPKGTPIDATGGHVPFAVLTVETQSGKRIELALPLDVPSRDVAAKIVRDLSETIRRSDRFELYIKTGRTDKRIPPESTLGELGLRDGQCLRLVRESGAPPAEPGKAYAYLRTLTGHLLPLETANVIIGRKDLMYQVPLDLDLAMYDPGYAVSRRHAAIGRESSTCYVMDLKSTNGTRLNGKTIVPGRKIPLKDGDILEFGLGVSVTFVLGKDAARK